MLLPHVMGVDLMFELHERAIVLHLWWGHVKVELVVFHWWRHGRWYWHAHDRRRWWPHTIKSHIDLPPIKFAFMQLLYRSSRVLDACK